LQKILLELQKDIAEVIKNLQSEKLKDKASQIYHEAPAVEPDIAPDMIKRLESSIVLDGSKCILECIAVGNRPFEIKWFKNGIEINDKNQNYVFNFNDKTGSIALVINKITKNDNALFSCRVINKLGMAETSAYLKVKGN
jgi:hypothetical protein